jgi:hypothetical protein
MVTSMSISLGDIRISIFAHGNHCHRRKRPDLCEIELQFKTQDETSTFTVFQIERNIEKYRYANGNSEETSWEGDYLIDGYGVVYETEEEESEEE